MPDWKKPMQQSFEYYTVDPGTWKDIAKIDNVKSCTISRDSEQDTLGSATIDVADLFGESYVRAYLITNQKGIKEKHPLGTFIVQTPSSTFDGKKKDVTMDAYTPLLELKENQPPIGYSILKGENIMEHAYLLTREHVRAPVVKTECNETLYNDFVSNTEDTWITYLRDLLANAKYEYGLDELGRIIYLPIQEIDSLQPVWTYNDDNSSILYPDLTLNHDLYDIPNVVEVIYSSGKDYYYARVVNDDPNSPVSTVKRGREKIHRVVNPSFTGAPSEYQIQLYAEQLLKQLSTVEYSVSYTHGYCPVRLGDCVRLNYTRAGLTNVKAKVISQSIKCTTGCSVSEKAVFTSKLWR